MRRLSCTAALAFLFFLLVTATARAQTAACCTQAGACTIRTQASCTSISGTWLGPGFVCSPGICTFGACCVPNTGCAFVNQSDCQTLLAGAWQGTLTTCQGSICQISACCSPTGACTALVATACASSGGTWLPGGISCSPQPCLAAACCTPAGSCILATELDCQSTHQGNWQGLPETACTPSLCSTLVDCCFGSSCRMLTSRACTHSGGVPTDATSCAAVGILCRSPGSCCTGTSCVSVATASACPAPGLFLVGVPCLPGPTCPRGACCLAGGTCGMLDASQCTTSGGRFLGLGVACQAVDCTPVACCTDALCQLNIRALCTGTVIEGPGSCTPDPCPPGACCGWYAGQCAMLTRSDCMKFDATFLAGTCSPANPCSPVLGACCGFFAVCSLATRNECISQFGYIGWRGSGSTCAPNPCCKADVNGNGTVTPQDLFDYLTSWFVGCP